MLLSLFMATFAIQTADDGFSKLQIFLQQLINWSVDAGGRIIGAVIIFVVLAGYIFLCAFFSQSICPELYSINMNASEPILLSNSIFGFSIISVASEFTGIIEIVIKINTIIIFL